MTPEGRVKIKVDALLKKYGVYYLKPVQNGMGAPALDYHCIHCGHGFTIEAKAPGKIPTPRQLGTMARVRAAGGTTWVTDGSDLDVLEAWLIYIKHLKEPSDDKQSHDRFGDTFDAG